MDGHDAHRGEPTCEQCARIRTDGGHNLYACDTPGCTEWKEVITPDGYVCRDCADELERIYEAEPEIVADGGTSWADLTGFQRDMLEAILRLENADETTYGLAINRELEDQYGEVNHGRLYPNLDELVDVGFVEKGQVDRRSNSYELTSSGRAVLEDRAHQLADVCGLSVAVTDGGDDA